MFSRKWSQSIEKIKVNSGFKLRKKEKIIYYVLISRDEINEGELVHAYYWTGCVF